MHGFRDSVQVFKMHGCYCRVCKNLEQQYSIPSHSSNPSNQIRYNASKRIQHYIYLFKLHSISIIPMLKNNLNICSKINKIRINGLCLQSEEFWNCSKDGKKVNILCFVDQNHQRSLVAVGHSRNFKDIQSKIVQVQQQKMK